MTSTAEAVGDLDAAIALLRGASSDDQRRRALDNALDALYKLREHRRLQPNHPKDYFKVADGCDDGQVTEGVVVARGARTHQLTKAEPPEMRPLYLGPDVYLSEDLLLGSHLTWLNTSELTPDAAKSLRQHDKRSHYELKVGRRRVLETLRSSQRFLTETTYLGPL